MGLLSGLVHDHVCILMVTEYATLYLETEPFFKVTSQREGATLGKEGISKEQLLGHAFNYLLDVGFIPSSGNIQLFCRPLDVGKEA